MQTDLLDSSPLSIVWSNLPCMELLHSAAMDATAFEPVSLVHGRAIIGANTGTFHLLVARLHDGHCSYAQLVHPADFELLEIDHGVRIRTPIFHQHLEKGVIRRGRICGWFMPAENDLQTAVELARQFVDEPLPLTT
ncbi:MAG: hypothetical protein JF612_08470 [Planctomycetia bacterium]|nr:hypothetical protein [Planctomycetia bacterium]